MPMQVTPYTTLNVDIWREVIQWAISYAKARPSEREAPLNLSNTCHAWREYILSHGQFWSRLKGNIKDNDTSYYEEKTEASGSVHAKCASMWLDRSGGALLKFRYFSYSGRSTENEVIDFQRSLVQKQASWLVMDIPWVTPEDTCSGRLDNLPNLRGWRLRSCEFGLGYKAGILDLDRTRFKDAYDTFFIKESKITHPIAPRLETLVIDGVEMGNHIDAVYGILAMLRQCPNLRDLCVSFSCVDIEETDVLNPDSPLCDLPKLRTLTVPDCSGALGPLYRLRAKSLEALTIEYIRFDRTLSYVVSDVSRLILRMGSSSSMRSVSITDESHNECDSQDLTDLLRALPNVELLLLDFRVPAPVFASLSFANHSKPLCPNLTVLEIGACPGFEDLSSLARMLISRFRHDKYFRALIDCCRFEVNKFEAFKLVNGLSLWLPGERLSLLEPAELLDARARWWRKANWQIEASPADADYDFPGAPSRIPL